MIFKVSFLHFQRARGLVDGRLRKVVYVRLIKVFPPLASPGPELWSHSNFGNETSSHRLRVCFCRARLPSTSEVEKEKRQATDEKIYIRKASIIVLENISVIE